jgi:hypothetical protein
MRAEELTWEDITAGPENCMACCGGIDHTPEEHITLLRFTRRMEAAQRKPPPPGSPAYPDR